VVLVTGDPLLAAALPLPSRPDAVPGAGPLGGVHTALLWAREEGAHGALCAACDLPFLAPGVLRLLLGRAAEGDAPAVAPESAARFGVEPLCAWWAVEALPEVERRLRAGEHALGPLLAALGAARIPRAELRRHGDPGTLFLNVNTPEDLRRAARLAAGGEEPDEHP
jgi:molybdopterin-guanine dinucleotide biosynthesis protein A